MLGRLIHLLLGALILLNAANAKPTKLHDLLESFEEDDDTDDLHSFLPVQGASDQGGHGAQSKEDLCASIYCGNGRECVLENDKPVCACALACPDHDHPVCGSDGVTYGNPCELHRAACLQNMRIHKHMLGPCEAPPPTEEPEPQTEDKPLVCYEIERDELRQLLIDWMKGRVEQEVKASDPSDISYARVLTDNFRECDLDGDNQLDSLEFMDCVERNQTVADYSGHRPEEGHILRGLCVDALILMSDTNEDWMLDLDEFQRCMDPDYKPPKKQCTLNGETYEDGAETRLDCNICVCACGNWVCSVMSCEDIEDYVLYDPYEVEQGPLPSKEERYALLRGFIASEHVNLDQVEQEVMTHPDAGHHDFPQEFPAVDGGAMFPEAGHHFREDNSDFAPAVGLGEEEDYEDEDFWPYSVEDESQEEIETIPEQDYNQEEEEEDEQDPRSNSTPTETDSDSDSAQAFDDYIRSVHKTFHHNADTLPTEEEVKGMGCCKDHGKPGHVHNHDADQPCCNEHGKPGHVHDDDNEQRQVELPEEIKLEGEDKSEEQETDTSLEQQIPTEKTEDDTKVVEAPTPSQPTPAPLVIVQEKVEEYVPPRRIIPVISFNITVAEHRVIHNNEGIEEQSSEDNTRHHEHQQTEENRGRNHEHEHNHRNNHHHKHNHHRNHSQQGHHQGNNHQQGGEQLSSS